MSTPVRNRGETPLSNALKPMVYTAVEHTATKGDAQSVIDTIDTFAREYRRIMIIGEDKGGKIDKVLKEHKPKVMYELGCFVGYSAVRFGSLIRQWGGKYYSFEVDAQSVEVSRKIVEHAGLSDTVEIIHGGFSDAIGPFLKDHPDHAGKVDAIFIDHWKDLYLPDIKLIESLNILHAGSVVLADNVLRPGAPEYIEHMKSQPNKYTSELLEYKDRGSNVVVDAVLYNVVKQ
ncbi:S-adenosyl-L-methionine-dependent methyltransferase [Umbelopsis sp. PMI_123]|nr:S-adenosyl-L-methionine-dependent methyltransferase [Umbelopsis sp. PMI_123]